MSDFSAFDNALRSLESIPLARVAGRLVRLNGILLESVGCPLMTGQLCRIESANHTLIDAQAVGFNRDITYLMPFKQPVGLMAGARVFPEEKAHDILIGESWLGRVVNGLGEPLDGKGRLNGNDLLPPLPPSVNPLTRRSVDEPLDVGVKAINGLLTIGKGQRVGLMAGSGVGKKRAAGDDHPPDQSRHCGGRVDWRTRARSKRVYRPLAGRGRAGKVYRRRRTRR